jgi:glycosyltransferase involved in cell wall biosynthesis
MEADLSDQSTSSVDEVGVKDPRRGPMRDGDPDAGHPTVTVVIPTHNRRELLLHAVTSALRQEGVALEVIVVDDGSSDGTAEMLAALTDRRVRVVHHETAQGVSAARNRGIEEARGEWIAFLDDDDLWAPDKLRLQLEAATKTGCRWVYVGHVNITLSNRVTGGGPPLPPDEVLRRLPQSDVVPGGCSGVVAIRRILEEVGLFDRQLQPLADWDLWLRLARTGAPASVSRPLVAYRVQTASMSMNTSRVQTEFEILARRYGTGNRAILLQYLGWWSARARRHLDAIRFFVRAAWQRDREYRTRDLARDVLYVVRCALPSSGKTPARRSFGSGKASHGDEHVEWRAEGQVWVDALIAGAHDPASPSGDSHASASAFHRRFGSRDPNSS